MVANYIVPQVLVFQEYNLVPTSTLRPLPAHIAGPHAFLRRFSDADEQLRIFVGYYDNAADRAYAWPDRPAGGVVDRTYTKVYIKDALLKYFNDSIGAGGTVARVAGYNNRIRSSVLSFATNGDNAHSDEFGDRGVKLGDVVRVRTAGTDLWTYVNGFVGEATSAVVGSASPGDDNLDTQAASATVTKTDGVDNCVSAIVPSAASYNGLRTGNVNEVYTVLVTQSSVGGDHTTARLRITSASGDDDVSSKIPSASGAPTAIGTDGATMIFGVDLDGTCSEEAEGSDVSPIDLIAGQTWELTVHGLFTKPVATAGGGYTGKKDATYIVNVTKGGLWGDLPEITVTTDIGYDVSGPTKVTGAAIAVAIGTKTTTIRFTGDGLRTGDVYTVPVSAAAEGAYRTLLLGHNLSDDIEDDEDVTIDLYIRKDLTVTENRTGFAPLVNYEQADTEITIKQGIQAYDSSYTVDGELTALPVSSASSPGYGKIYVEYRAWLSDLCNGVGTIDDVGDLDTLISGALHPDNPLKWGVFKALSNSNGQGVKYTSVCDPDSVESWSDVLALLDGRKDVYGLVPLTYNQTVLDLWAAHVDAQSSPENGRWRVTFVGLQDVPQETIVSELTSTDGEVVLAVLEDDPNTSGTQYTLLRVPDGNGQFIANGLRPNDVVRFLYSTDGFGNDTYTEFVIDEVLSEDELRLLTGHSVAVSVAQKMTVVRNLSKDERAAAIAKRCGAYGSHRVRAVWPDVAGSGEVSMAGYYVAAALAGEISGVVSHQSCTGLSLSGFDDVSRSVNLFSRTQLNVMAAAGVWIVTQDPDTGAIYTRHGLTTAAGDGNLNTKEEMVVRNLDAISYLFADRFAPYIGISNVVPSFLAVVRVETESLITFLRGNNFVRRLGSQLIDGTIIDLRAHTLLKDRVVLAVQLSLPYAANNIETHLVV